MRVELIVYRRSKKLNVGIYFLCFTFLTIIYRMGKEANIKLRGGNEHEN